MTRPLRRDGRTKNASVITGLRLEPETATALCDRAIADARDAKSGRGNVGELARFFIRTGLGLSAAEANRREETGAFSSCVAGLAMEDDVCKRLANAAERLGLTKAGAARHYIRLGLGYSQANSAAREVHFAELAEAKRGTAMAGSAQFRGTR